MECDEARQLLDRGVQPGTDAPVRTLLGFHLAQCPACRTYHAESASQLLQNLLSSSSANRMLLRDLLSQPPPLAPPQTTRNWRMAAWATRLIVLVVAFWFVGQLAWAFVTIGRNVQAMQVTTAPLPPLHAPVVRDRPTTLRPPPTVPAPTAGRIAVVPAATNAPTQQATAPRALITAAPSQPIAVTSTLARQRIAFALQPDLGVNVELVPTAGPLDIAGPILLSPTPAPPTFTPVPRVELPTVTAAPLLAVGSTPLPASTRGTSMGINVLLLGSDKRPDEYGPARTDTMIIAHLDPARQRVALLSLPRDLVVPIPGVGYGRINSAHVYGELDPAIGGLNLARQTVSELLGIPIHYVVALDFAGFVGAIDAIGGVDITVEQALYDNAYPTMDYGYSIVSFELGQQHMDGERALIYGRIRHGDSDFARAQRQQSVIVAAIERVRTQNSFAQIQSMARITEALRTYIRTDMALDQMVNVAWSMRTIRPAAVERYALDGTMVEMGRYADDPYALYALPGMIERLARLLIDGS